MLSKEEYEKIVIDYFEEKKKHDEISKKFNDVKKRFYDVSNSYFEDNEIKKSFNVESGKSNLLVSMVKRVKLVFDADKLEKKIGKKFSKEVIDKKIEIEDTDGFMKYMKSISADPNVLKSFFNVSKEVNKEALDQLEAVGKIDGSDIEDCYEVKVMQPTFQLRERKN